MDNKININVLDYGFVRHIESWGRGESGIDEAGIIEAARQSTQGIFRGWEIEAKLLEFLFTNQHSTPFEFAGMTIEVRAPILVFREWHRHRTQSYNEMSARYAPLPDIKYLPTKERLFLTQENNKQAQAKPGSELLTEASAKDWLEEVNALYEHAEEIYQLGLNSGVPKEVARIVLPVGQYSQMRASANLRNWVGFLILRTNPNAQYEIRMFANAVAEIVKQEFPRTWAIFEKLQAEIKSK